MKTKDKMFWEDFFRVCKFLVPTLLIAVFAIIKVTDSLKTPIEHRKIISEKNGYVIFQDTVRAFKKNWVNAINEVVATDYYGCYGLADSSGNILISATKDKLLFIHGLVEAKEFEDRKEKHTFYNYNGKKVFSVYCKDVEPVSDYIACKVNSSYTKILDSNGNDILIIHGVVEEQYGNFISALTDNGRVWIDIANRKILLSQEPGYGLYVHSEQSLIVKQGIYGQGTNIYTFEGRQINQPPAQIKWVSYYDGKVDFVICNDETMWKFNNDTYEFEPK